MNHKPVNEPNHVAVDLYRGDPRMVNGRKHSTVRTNEIRVVSPKGKIVCVMAESNQDSLDTAWLIAQMLDKIPEPTAHYGSLRQFMEEARNQTPFNDF